MNPPLGELDRPGEDLLAGEAAVPIVKRQPAVDRSRYRHAGEIASQRHGVVTPALNVAGFTPDPARPMESSASGSQPGSETIARTSPPRPQR